MYLWMAMKEELGRNHVGILLQIKSIPM